VAVRPGDAVPTPHHCPKVCMVTRGCAAATPHPLPGAVKWKRNELPNLPRKGAKKEGVDHCIFYNRLMMPYLSVAGSLTKAKLSG